MSKMTQPDSALPLDDPQLTPFLPLLYIAWADGELEDGEIVEICSRIHGPDGLATDCESVLGRWLDPSRPPTAMELRSMLTSIEEGARGLDQGQRHSIRQLGVELARLGGSEVSEPEGRALAALEGALGLGMESTGRFSTIQLPPEDDSDVRGPATFDEGALTRLLDGEHRSLRERFRRLLSEPRFAHVYGLERGAYRDQVLAWCRILAEEGLGSLAYPPEYGGEGDTGASVAAFEMLAFHDLSLLIKYGVQFGLFGGSILHLGTETHHEKYLRRVGNLDLPGCFAMTETGHGSNVYDIETTATFDPATQEFVIHTPNDQARKDYIGNAARHGRQATVFAQLLVAGESYGVHAIVVRIRDDEGRPMPGVRIADCGEKLGLNGVDNGRLWFDQVRVPRDNLLDRFAQVHPDGRYESPIASPSKRFFTMLGTLVNGRVSIALAGLSASKSALTIAVRYAVQRRQFGPDGERETLLLDYRTHQRRLLPRLATTFALDFALKHLVRQLTQSSAEERRHVESLAAGLKAYATWHATDTIQACREACGGQGYLAVNRFASLKADTDIFTTFEGDNTVLLLLVAKSLLSGFKRQFSSMNAFGLLRYLAGEAATAITELNPAITRRTDPEHLRDGEFHRAAFEWRERHLVSTLGKRLKKRLDRGLSGFEALLECQDHALTAAKAHVEALVLVQMQDGLGGMEDGDLASVLGSVCDLFALSRIEEDRGWFLEHGYLEGSKAKAIRQQVNQLCAELRPHALSLVRGFGIPESLLAAPIAGVKAPTPG